jgi:hypothetical protein
LGISPRVSQPSSITSSERIVFVFGLPYFQRFPSPLSIIVVTFWSTPNKKQVVKDKGN